MKCSICGGLVTWRGPLTNLTHTQCYSCGGINCQEPDNFDDPEPEEIGRTTQQMLDAPKGSFFVWPNRALDYPRALARHLGREDLQIRPPYWINFDTVRLPKDKEIVIDHATILGYQELYWIIERDKYLSTLK